MGKFITKDIDYTGCHPDIANALKQGKAIRCSCSNSSTRISSKTWIIGFDYKSSDAPYISEEDDSFEFAEPIQAKRILKDPVSIMKILVEEGWVYEKENAMWGKPKAFQFFSSWHFCGKEYNQLGQGDYPDNFYTYEEE